MSIDGDESVTHTRLTENVTDIPRRVFAKLLSYPVDKETDVVIHLGVICAPDLDVIESYRHG